MELGVFVQMELIKVLGNVLIFQFVHLHNSGLESIKDASVVLDIFLLKIKIHVQIHLALKIKDGMDLAV